MTKLVFKALLDRISLSLNRVEKVGRTSSVRLFFSKTFFCLLIKQDWTKASNASGCNVLPMLRIIWSPTHGCETVSGKWPLFIFIW
ncbi:unnamed protein product [Moneuplotes crassus]|uniref:Uncharacterized protein n=1 Tax=Euplotes crassus TaxID=5936 RepID=A0AAD1UH86_EUPCR|nr:unnamed protein product [Moneuplotes crassus]